MGYGMRELERGRVVERGKVGGGGQSFSRLRMNGTMEFVEIGGWAHALIFISHRQAKKLWKNYLFKRFVKILIGCRSFL